MENIHGRSKIFLRLTKGNSVVVHLRLAATSGMWLWICLFALHDFGVLYSLRACLVCGGEGRNFNSYYVFLRGGERGWQGRGNNPFHVWFMRGGDGFKTKLLFTLTFKRF